MAVKTGVTRPFWMPPEAPVNSLTRRDVIPTDEEDDVTPTTTNPPVFLRYPRVSYRVAQCNCTPKVKVPGDKKYPLQPTLHDMTITISALLNSSCGIIRMPVCNVECIKISAVDVLVDESQVVIDDWKTGEELARNRSD